MLIVLLNNDLVLQSFTFCFILELFRILLGYFFARPSSEINVLQIQKFEANQELALIKSVQLELVRHSLLTRKVIKIDKQIEKVQSEHAPRIRNVKYVARIIRLVAYAAFSVYYFNASAVIIDPKILWPISVFVYQKTLSLPVWFLVFVGGFSWRHIFRSILQIVFRQREFV